MQNAFHPSLSTLACRFDRYCLKDYTYKDMTIPKGSAIVVPSFVLHKDPKYWKDPLKFDPMRYTAVLH